ncbi:MAG: universal stress protein [Kiloniellales bacterium]
MSDQPKTDSGRVFLVVIDETEELGAALRFACLRARRTGGRVALLFVMQPAEFQHWMAVGDLMREEQRETAEQLLHKWSGVVNQLTGQMPVVYVREGDPKQELAAVIDEETSISVLVLGAGTGAEGPGPLVTHFVNKMAGGLRIPITVVPGSLTDEQIDAIA